MLRLNQPRVVHHSSLTGRQIDVGRNDAIHLKQAVPDSKDAIRAAHPFHRQEGHRLLPSFFDRGRFVDGVDVTLLIHAFPP
jgi:hypothetical protein